MSKLSFAKPRRRLNFALVRSIAVWIFQIAIVCLIAFVCIWFFGQRVSTIGDSMKPVLRNGDIVLVNRIVYDASSPDRGDIVVFKPNGNENSHFYIKRLIGMPGEKVLIQEGKIYIDGKELEEQYTTTEIEEAGIAAEEIQLSGDEYFVLGDNRKNSEDSRMADIGTVKRSEIYGKAWFIVSPHEHFGFIKEK